MNQPLAFLLKLRVDQDLIVSPAGDISAVFSAEYPPLYTRSREEYETLHQGRIRALAALPPGALFVQQDRYGEDQVRLTTPPEASFLAGASDAHFRGRAYFRHTCHIIVTVMPGGHRPVTSALSSLLRPHLSPPETIRPDAAAHFLESLGRFAGLMEEAGIRLRRLKDAEMRSTDKEAGLLEKYFLQPPLPEGLLLGDLELRPEVRAAGSYCRFYTLADPAGFPGQVSPWAAYPAYSTEETAFPVGFAAFAGPLLPCTHLYNQFILLEDPEATRRRLEKKNKRLYALARYSRENAVTQQKVDAYLQEMVAESRRPCRMHFNVMTLAEDPEEAARQGECVSTAFSRMGAVAKRETCCAPQLFWAAVPGNASQLPVDHTLESFTEAAACLINCDGDAREDARGVRFADRLSGRPVTLDLFDEPMQKGVIANRNLFVCGGSGGGKSMVMNHLLRTLYDQGTHCVTVDIGGSYRGLTALTDGYYFSYTEAEPIRFNPFYLPAGGTPGTEKTESLKALLVSLWKQETESYGRAEYVALSAAIEGYYRLLEKDPGVFPCFDTFYDYLRDDYASRLAQLQVRERDFDLAHFLYVLRPYYRGGEFDYLLNAREQIDLVSQRFIVFELDTIKDHPILFPVVTLIIMELFISKMRRLPGVRKILVIEEAWKAIARSGMAEFIRYAFKTVRKFNGIAAVVTQEIDDLITSPIIRETIIQNADIKILTDMRKFMHKFGALQATLGLTEKAKTLLLSVNRHYEPGKKYREVFIDLGGQTPRVYRHELSPEEYDAYTTEATEKMTVAQYAAKYGGFEEGIRVLEAEKRSRAAP